MAHLQVMLTRAEMKSDDSERAVDREGSGLECCIIIISLLYAYNILL